MHAPETTEMVECLVKRTTWYNGEVAAPGTVVDDFSVVIMSRNIRPNATDSMQSSAPKTK